MQFAQSILLSVAVASVANGLVIPSVESNQASAAAASLATRDFRSKIVKASANGIPNKYIVVLKEDAHIPSVKSKFAKAQKNVNAEFNSEFDFDFDGFKGFAAEIHDDDLDKLAAEDSVLLVEQDAKVHTSEATTQEDAPWGIARISTKESLNGATTGKYLYDSEGGDGVTAYIVDTGINTEHEDFEGRAKWGTTFPTDGDSDGVGHGTHCAGTIGSKTYGVAKKANLVAVKVLGNDGSGTNSDVIKGINYVAAEHKKNAGKSGYKGSTANMSLGGSKSDAVNSAADAAVAAGVHFAVAAGNDSQDACNTSPASAENVITVGATDNSDKMASFSNFGKCVDIFGPGVDILSTWIGGTDKTNTISGTSMATPHITGLLTYFLSLAPSSNSTFTSKAEITPAQMKKAIVAFGTKLDGDFGTGSPNVFAYNGAGGDLSQFWSQM